SREQLPTNRGSVYNFPTGRSGYHWDTSDWRGAAATLGGLGASRGPGNPPDLIMDGGPFSVSYFGGAGCRQRRQRRHRSPSNASTSTSAAASAPPLVVIGCGGGGGGFGGFGGLAEESEEIAGERNGGLNGS
uniref:CG-1 domain-containing protein n=1 Tax=Macrostomum lignano TaxID=282301 RepID=A0A1I8FJ84_9PLAT